MGDFQRAWTLAGFLLLTLVSIGRAQGRLELITASSPAVPEAQAGGGDSSVATLSADGRRVVFASAARDLIPDTGTERHINLFVRDRLSGVTSLVSQSLDGKSGGDGDSYAPVLSGDGRYVVFQSSARNLVTNQTWGTDNIFLHDLQTRKTILVSANASGLAGNGWSRFPTMTPDARWVVYESAATNLVSTPTTGEGDIYLWDHASAATRLVSIEPGGTAGGSDRSWSPVIDDGARYVCFETRATNLVAGVAVTRVERPVLMDLAAKTSAYPVLDREGLPPQVGLVSDAILSRSGRYLVFLSTATNLTPETPGEVTNPSLYWRDLETKTTRMIADSSSPLAEDLGQFTLSANGEVVAFTHTNQVFLWRSAEQEAKLITTTTNGIPSAGASGAVVVSADGMSLLFVSNAEGLLPVEVVPGFQVYHHDIASGILSLVSCSAEALRGGRGDCSFPVLSADAKVAAFECLDTDLVPGDSNQSMDVYVRDLAGAKTELISTKDPTMATGVADQGGCLVPAGLSVDGRYVLFASASDAWAPVGVASPLNLIVHDRLLEKGVLVNQNAEGGVAVVSDTSMVAMTPDATHVAFFTRAENMVRAGVDTNANHDLYLRDMLTGTNQLISLNPEGTAAAGASLSLPVLSSDARFVAYLDRARQVVFKSVAEGTPQFFTMPSSTLMRFEAFPVAITAGPRLWYRPMLGLVIHDAASGTETLALTNLHYYGTPAVASNGTTAVAWLKPLGGSALGSLAVYQTTSPGTNLIITKAPVSASRVPGAISISDEGQMVVFVDSSASGSEGETNGYDNIYLADLGRLGLISLVSVNASGTGPGNGSSSRPCLSANGRFVVFHSLATDLLPDPPLFSSGIYVRDLEAGVTWPVYDEAFPWFDAPVFSFAPFISPDGQVVVFTSVLDSLAGRSNNGRMDVLASVLVHGVPADYVHHTPASNWLIRFFGTSVHDSNADSDGDGATDWQEFVAGSDPTNPESRMRLHVEHSVSEKATTLTWMLASQRSYRLQYKDKLEEVDWHELGESIKRGSYGQARVVDPDSGLESQRYYRLLVEY